jgi:RHS repeat-associated protein
MENNSLSELSFTTTFTLKTYEWFYYKGTGHLGSICQIIKPDGTVIEKTNYDPWGRVRNPETWNYPPQTGNTVESRPLNTIFRGYTGHEHLPHFALINMNGRMYDPVLGRMLSPDNYVQNPNIPQNYNRYAYVLNNPLKYTDPSGEFWHLVIGAAIGGTINWAVNGADFTWEGAMYFGIGAVAGAVGAGVGMGVTATLTGGAATFGGGFVGSEITMAAISASFETSFLAGAMIGGYSGFAQGFINGAGNSAMKGNCFSTVLGDSFRQGAMSAMQNALITGSIQGLDALADGRSFFNGELKTDKYGKLIPSKHDLVGQIEYQVESIEREIIPEFEHDYANELNNFKLDGYKMTELAPTKTALQLTRNVDVTVEFSANYKYLEGGNVFSETFNISTTTSRFSYINRFNRLWGKFYKW